MRTLSLSRVSLSLSRIPAIAEPPRAAAVPPWHHHRRHPSHPTGWGTFMGYLSAARTSQSHRKPPTKPAKSSPEAATIFDLETHQDGLSLCNQHQGFVELEKTNQTPLVWASSEPPRAATARSKLARRWPIAAATVLRRLEVLPTSVGDEITWI